MKNPVRLVEAIAKVCAETETLQRRVVGISDADRRIKEALAAAKNQLLHALRLAEAEISK